MEASGTGFDKIAEAYSVYDKQHQPYIYAMSDHFTLVLPDVTYNKASVDQFVVLGLPAIENESEYDRRILEFCYLDAKSAPQIAKMLGITASQYLRNTILQNLVDQNLLLKEQAGSRRYEYSTNRDLVVVQ